MRNLIFILMLSAVTAAAKPYSVESPNGRLAVNVNKFASDYTHYETVLPADGRLTAPMAPGGGWVAKIFAE